MTEEYDAPSEEEILSDQEFGQTFASNGIATARRIHPSSREKQAEYLRWWFQVAKAFPASSVYSQPILAGEINRLEGPDPKQEGKRQ